MHYKVSAKIDQGCIRDSQQDALIVIPDIENINIQLLDNEVNDTMKAGIYIIADGMGGSKSGDIASKLAINSLVHYFSSVEKNKLADCKNLLIESALYANHTLLDYVEKHDEDKGMGSTLIMALLLRENLHICWVGDSRCYGILRDHSIKQLSKDHSYVQLLLDEGKITPEMAINHPNRNIITQSLGMVEMIPSYISYKLADYSHIYLCSDGITTMISDEEIKEIIYENDDVCAANSHLVDAANKAGGHDNISSILISFDDEEAVTPGIEAEVPVSTTSPSKSKWVIGIIILIIVALVLLKIYQSSSSGNVSIKRSDADTVAYLNKPIIPGALNHSAVRDTNAHPVKTMETGIASPGDSTINIKDKRKFNYYIRLSVFPNKASAEQAASQARKKYSSEDIEVRKLNNGLFETCVNGFESSETAGDFIDKNHLTESLILIDRQVK